MPAKPNRAARGKNAADVLSLGEGTEKGFAYRRAQTLARRGSKERLVAVDLQKPGYELPSNLVWIQANALKHLDGIAPGSVRIVRDDYFFHYTGGGKRVQTQRDSRKDLKALEAAAGGFSKPGDRTLENFKRNERKYIKLVRRALVPGGRFLITTDSGTRRIIEKLLLEAGFSVSSRRLGVCATLKSGSPQAKRELLKFSRTYRIVAAKPRKEPAK